MSRASPSDASVFATSSACSGAAPTGSRKKAMELDSLAWRTRVLTSSSRTKSCSLGGVMALPWRRWSKKTFGYRYRLHEPGGSVAGFRSIATGRAIGLFHVRVCWPPLTSGETLMETVASMRTPLSSVMVAWYDRLVFIAATRFDLALLLLGVMACVKERIMPAGALASSSWSNFWRRVTRISLGRCDSLMLLRPMGEREAWRCEAAPAAFCLFMSLLQSKGRRLCLARRGTPTVSLPAEATAHVHVHVHDRLV